MSKEDQSAPAKESPNVLADLLKQHGYSPNAVEIRREREQGVEELQASAGTAKEQAAKLTQNPSHVIAGGSDFFTTPTPGDIAKTKAGPHMDAEGHPMTDKAWEAQHHTAHKPQRGRE